MAELLDEIYEICLEKPDMWPDHRNVVSGTESRI